MVINGMIESVIPPHFGPEPPLIAPEALASWVIYEDERVLALNKPGWVVCHPSKNGPWSSLVGAAREYLGCETLHLVSRLDRETSGLVVLAKDRGMARLMQMALQNRRVDKRYTAILEGSFPERMEVSRPLESDVESPVVVKQRVSLRGGGQKAQTTFVRREVREGFSLVDVIPHTGRKHQIRVHAQWTGYPVVGDKLYGPDPLLYLEFVESGWTSRHASTLGHYRQALHASRVVFDLGRQELEFEAPLAEDLDALWASFLRVEA